MDEHECEQFFQDFEYRADPTWGFYVYGTYSRPQGQENANKHNEDGEAHDPI
jgi:hypothetical protein